MNGWQIFEKILEWLWIFTGIGLLFFVGYLVVTILHFKTAVVGNAKRLYERPVNSVKSLAATGKAIAQQEKVRFQHMAGTVKGTAGDVKEAATEIKAAAQSVHPAELKVALSNVQSTFRFMAAAVQLVKATSHQGRSHTEA